MIKKTLKGFLASALVLGALVPSTAFASEGKSISAGAGEIKITSLRMDQINAEAVDGGTNLLEEIQVELERQAAEAKRIAEEAARKAEEERIAKEKAELERVAREAAEKNKRIIPVANAWITSDYGVYREMILQDGSYYSDIHTGIDYVNGNPMADIMAYKQGTVVAAGVDSTGSNYVILDHGDHFSHYHHLSSGSIAVSVGQKVSVGHRLGAMGSTGWSTGAHLHFAITTGSAYGPTVNPHNYLP